MTVTVLLGTTIAVTTSKGIAINIAGVLDIQGTKASKVVIRPASADEFWADTSVVQGGVMRASYLVQTGCGISIAAGAKVTLVDTRMSHSPGDFLVMSGGTLDMSYSAIGLELAGTPVTGDFSHSYFAKGPPTGPGLTATSMATSRVADAGVR